MIAELTPLRETQVGRELLEEGIEQGEEKIILKLAQCRFPELSSAQEEKIRALPGNQLEELAVALLSFESLTELETWLGKRQSV